MADRTISDLMATLKNYFKIGTVRLKNTSGTLEVRTVGDTSYAQANASIVGIAGSNASNKVLLQVPAGLGGNVSLTLPPDAGTVGYVLRTDGNGILTWVPVASNASVIQEEGFTQATSSPLTIVAPEDNSVVSRVIIAVDSAASAGSPTLNIGTAGDPDRDMDETEVDLKTVGIYEVAPMTDVGEDPDDIIASIVPDSQTFSGRIYLEVTVAS
jgi:hypothetical protein